MDHFVAVGRPGNSSQWRCLINGRAAEISAAKQDTETSTRRVRLRYFSCSALLLSVDTDAVCRRWLHKTVDSRQDELIFKQSQASRVSYWQL